MLYQVALKVRRKIKVKLPLQTPFSLNIIYFFLSFLLTTFTTEVRVSHLSNGKQTELHRTLFHWSFIAPRSDIAFTFCQTSPTDKISKLKVKPLRINDLEEGIFFQLCCLDGSNFSNFFSLVSTLNLIKA